MKIKNLVLDRVKIEELMNKNIVIGDIQSDPSLIIERLVDINCNEAIIIENNNAIAIVTIIDLLKIQNSCKSLKEYIVSNDKYIKYALYVDNTAFDLLNILSNSNNIESIPILDTDKKPVGLINHQIFNRLYPELIDKSYNLFENIINNMHDAICAVDKDNRVIIWNKSAENLYEIKERDIEGKLVTQVFPSALLPKVIRQKKAFKNVYNNPRENCYDIITATPLYDEGELIGAVSCDMDISELTRISQLLNKARTNISMLENEVSKFNESRLTFSQMIGANKRFCNVVDLCKNISKSKIDVLIVGESGTGKEAISRAIHIKSASKGYFIPVNCSMTDQGKLDKILFGNPNANTQSQGKFELADRGTIFLEEIGDLSLENQDKVLKFMDKPVIRKNGVDTNVDVRMIASTSSDLKKKVKKGLFSKELYCRLSAVSVIIPPLRERKEDIPLLVNKFMKDLCMTYRRNIIEVPDNMMNMLVDYEWKGNIRELKNVLERAVILSKNNNLNGETFLDILPDIEKKQDYEGKTLDLNRAIEDAELNSIKRAMDLAKGNKVKAAKFLNIPRSTLYFKLKKYNLE